MSTFVVTFPDPSNTAAMDAFQNLMDATQASYTKEIELLALDLNIPTFGGAANIWYLRQRSRWTQEKEEYLIWIYQNKMEGPNIMDDFEVPVNYRNDR